MTTPTKYCNSLMCMWCCIYNAFTTSWRCICINFLFFQITNNCVSPSTDHTVTWQTVLPVLDTANTAHSPASRHLTSTMAYQIFTVFWGKWSRSIECGHPNLSVVTAHWAWLSQPVSGHGSLSEIIPACQSSRFIERYYPSLSVVTGHWVWLSQPVSGLS